MTFSLKPLARRARPLLARQYATPVKEPNPQLNGYPELPNVSSQYRNPLGWDDKLLRRNFGDTVHHHEEVNSMWGPDVPVIPPDRALRHAQQYPASTPSTAWRWSWEETGVRQSSVPLYLS
ncbi:hypothetical protein B0H19DRAFT_1189147 [Mycena capillaripes]|nr:hypothetical protein B0H19DRAFT_1189147 [Mycena capillaripes]